MNTTQSRKLSVGGMSRKSSSSSGGQLDLRDTNEEQPTVLHRTDKRVILAGDHLLYKPSLDANHEFRGWKAPVHVPYKPLGTF